MDKGLNRRDRDTTRKLAQAWNKIIWLPAEKELYAITDFALADVKDGTWQTVAIKDCPEACRVMLNVQLSYTFFVNASISNAREAVGKILVPVITESAATYKPENPPSWAGTCQGPIAICYLPLKASDTRYGRGFGNWQGWADLNPDGKLEFMTKFRYYGGNSGAEMDDDANMQVSAINVRIGMMAYGK